MKGKVLVTGGAGFIGSHVAEKLLADGYEVVVADDLSTGKRENVPRQARFYEIDITDSSRLMELFARERPGMVNHQAAQIDVRKSVADPLFDARTNVLGTLSVLEAARQHGVSRFVFASSGGAIYGEPAGNPVPESNALRPISPYGVAKLAGEHYLEFFAKTYGIESVALRYSNVYGPRQNSRGEAGVVAIFIERLLRGEPPVVFGDGKQTRDYVHVEDVARANIAAMKMGRGVYNIGTGREKSVLDVLEAVAEALGKRVDPRHVEARAGEVSHISLDCSRAKRELSWEPHESFSSGIAKTVAWYRNLC